MIQEFLFENVRSEMSRYGSSSAGCLPLLAKVEDQKVESNVIATCTGEQ